ncbi:MAG TPA: oligosaccharide flippase family protein, partial [Solirubrobacteraceae bacterium]|nr:oligosaccharide flippase family protein [Solirubrobacteraceae bacterium]
WPAPADDLEGATLGEEIAHWLAEGHRVTLVAPRERGRAGGPRREEPAPGLVVRRMGSRRSIVPRAAWATLLGLGRDADVVLEAVHRRPFMTPLWRWLAAPPAIVPSSAGFGMLYRGVPAMGEQSWDAREAAGLEVLREAAATPSLPLSGLLRSSETAKAGGLAAASLANNAIQLVFVVVFTRLLGADDYGSLAALVSAFLILMVGGQALQVAAARETTLRHLGDGPRLAATMESWTRRLVLVAFAALGAGLLLRGPLGHVVGVPDHSAAAGLIPCTGVLWALVSLQRGVLQGAHVYAPVGVSIVGEAVGRLACGLALYGAGAGVTGAFAGTPLTMALIAVALVVVGRRRFGHPAGHGTSRSLRLLLSEAWAPIAGLGLLALLQNVDVLVVKHRIGGDAAGSYAAAAVAAKSVVWVAIGIALQLLPDATRREAEGANPLPTLVRAVGVLAVVAAPAVLIFFAVPTTLLRLAFGTDLTQAHEALPLLGVAMTLLAAAYLMVQYMLALGRTLFLWVLGAIAIAEPFLLSAGDWSLAGYAALVLALEAAALLGMSALVVRGARRRRREPLPVATGTTR